MKAPFLKNFKAGDYISDALEQVANNINLFDNNTEWTNNVNCVNTLCSNVRGIYDCEFESIGKTKKRTHNTFLVTMLGDSMMQAGINDGDILLVDGSTQAVNNSIIVAEINNCVCVKRIKFLRNQFILFAENNKYPPIPISKSDNFIVWGVVRTTLEKM